MWLLFERPDGAALVIDLTGHFCCGFDLISFSLHQSKALLRGVGVVVDVVVDVVGVNTMLADD